MEKGDIVMVFIIILMSVLAIVLANIQFFNPPDKVSDVGAPAVSEIKTFALTEGVLDKFPAVGGNVGGITKYFDVKGIVKSAVIEFSAAVNHKDLDIQYDSVYLKIGNGRAEMGGHYVGDNKIDLSGAQLFRDTNRVGFDKLNFIPLINSGRQIRVDMFVSSARPDRWLNAVLKYECETAGQCEIL